MWQKIMDDYRLQYLNDLFEIKLIFLRSKLYVAIFSTCKDAKKLNSNCTGSSSTRASTYPGSSS